MFAVVSFISLKLKFSLSLSLGGNLLSSILFSFVIGFGFFFVFCFFVYCFKEFALNIIPLPILFNVFAIVFSIKNLILSVVFNFTYDFWFFWIINITLSLSFSILAFIWIYHLLSKYLKRKKKFFSPYIMWSVVYLMFVTMFWWLGA